MISIYSLADAAKKQQPTDLNIRREYIQHLFLSYFYRQRETNTVYFKGGTALRIVFGSPRFSEDLDFSAKLSKTTPIEKTIVRTLIEIKREGVLPQIIESKETSGGHFAELLFRIGFEDIHILLQISKRNPLDDGEAVTIASGLVPAYTLVMLDRKQLVREKVEALLTRGKPRDYYDVYFLIRSRLLGKKEKEVLISAKRKLAASTINFEYELKQFLPKSHWPIIRDFSLSFVREVDRL